MQVNSTVITVYKKDWIEKIGALFNQNYDD